MNVLVKKKDLLKFYDRLKGEYEIIGPVKRGNNHVFDVIESFDDLNLEKQTNFSIRKFFLPDGETLLEFDKNGPKQPLIETKKRILILHPCDANALLNLDKVYLEDHPDANYKYRRENTLIFVIKCKEPYKNCFCSSFNTYDTTNFDLLFVDVGEKFIVRPGSEIGKQLVDNKTFIPIIRDGRIIVKCEREAKFLDKLNFHKEDKIWEKYADKCLNCNACISVCPTCMCFRQHDEMNIDGESGKRKRYWSYCHMKEFTKVAGGFVFRENKINRFRHRIYHKLHYFKQNHGKHLCVGCGRCIEVCPAKIDMLKIIEELGK